MTVGESGLEPHFGAEAMHERAVRDPKTPVPDTWEGNPETVVELTPEEEGFSQQVEPKLALKILLDSARHSVDRKAKRQTEQEISDEFWKDAAEAKPPKKSLPGALQNYYKSEE